MKRVTGLSREEKTMMPDMRKAQEAQGVRPQEHNSCLLQKRWDTRYVSHSEVTWDDCNRRVGAEHKQMTINCRFLNELGSHCACFLGPLC